MDSNTDDTNVVVDLTSPAQDEQNDSKELNNQEATKSSTTIVLDDSDETLGENEPVKEEEVAFDEYVPVEVPIFYRVEDPTCYGCNKWEDPSLMWNPSIEPIIFPDEYRPPATLEDALKETNLSKETAAMLVQSCAAKVSEEEGSESEGAISPYVQLLVESEDVRNLFTEQLMMPCNLERLPWKGLLYNTLFALRSLGHSIGTFYCVEQRQKSIQNRGITWNSFLYVTDNPDVFLLKDNDESKTIYVLEETWAYFVRPSLYIMEPGSNFYVREMSVNKSTLTVYMSMIRNERDVYSIFPKITPYEEEKEQVEKPKDEPIPLNINKSSYSYQELLLMCSYIQKNFDYKRMEHFELINVLIKKSIALITNRDFSMTIVSTLASTAKNMIVLAKLVDCDLFSYLTYLLNIYSRDFEFRNQILNLMKLISLAGHSKIHPDADELYKFFEESLEYPQNLKFIVEIIKTFTINYKFAEKLVETNILKKIEEILYEQYDNLPLCNFLSAFLLYLFKTSKVFQMKLKNLSVEEIGMIIAISSKIEYFETMTFNNMVSIILLIPVTEENSYLFIETSGIIIKAIQNGQSTKEFINNVLKTFSSILKYPEIVDSFLQNEGLEIVLNQLCEPNCTEQTKQTATSIFKYLSYENSALDYMLKNGVLKIVLIYLNEYITNPVICESGLTLLRNILRFQKSKSTLIELEGLPTVAAVFKANSGNVVIAKKVCGIMQNVAFSADGKRVILTQVPHFFALVLDSLKRHWQVSKSLCADAMSALKNMAAGDFAFKLAPLLPSKEIVAIAIQIVKMYHADSRVCTCTCSFLCNMFSSVEYGKEFFEQGGIEEFVKLLKEYSFEGVVCTSVMNAFRNVRLYEPAKERIKTIFVEDKEIISFISNLNANK